MNELNLDFIERELGIKLPSIYRQRLLVYPIPACVGNSDTALWDDAGKLVVLNRKLRAGAPGGIPMWRTHMFALGQIEGDPSVRAIDLRVPEAPVWWVDHCHLDGQGSGQTHATFSN